MIPTSVTIELVICILFMIAYLVYVITTGRKKPFFFNILLWSVAAYFIRNAITTLITIVPVAIMGETAASVFFKEHRIVLLFFTGIASAVAVVFATHFVLGRLKRIGRYEKASTSEVLGLSMGAAELVIPSAGSASIMVLIQNLMNVMILNQNPTVEELGDIDPEILEQLRAFFMSLKILDFVYVAVIALAIAYSFRAIAKIVDKTMHAKNPIIRFGLPIGIYFVFYLVVQSVNLFMLHNAVYMVAAVIGTALITFVETKIPYEELVA